MRAGSLCPHFDSFVSLEVYSLGAELASVPVQRTSISNASGLLRGSLF